MNGKDVAKIEKKIRYSFKDKGLLETAFTYSSYTPDLRLNNERLEFVGDSILGFIITDYLMRNFERDDEGVMTDKRKMLVNTKTLAKAAEESGLVDYMILGKNAVASQKMKASLFEAIVAAIYYDGGEESARGFIFGFLERYIKNGDEDYKTILNERAFGAFGGYPEYDCREAAVDVGGPRVFECTVTINGEPKGRGQGSSKKEAEQTAAKAVCQKL
ncbi:MAG: ribonuclease III [Clostridiales bacterium]|jgi:ribonuclease-3|nr:ribonuclease III [Clostridiales bacterium]